MFRQMNALVAVSATFGWSGAAALSQSSTVTTSSTSSPTSSSGVCVPVGAVRDALVTTGALDAQRAEGAPDMHDMHDMPVLPDMPDMPDLPKQDDADLLVAGDARVMAVNADQEADYGLAWGRVDAFVFPPTPGDSAALDALRAYVDHDDAGRYSAFGETDEAETRVLPNIIPVPTPVLIGLGGLIAVIVTRRRVLKRL